MFRKYSNIKLTIVISLVLLCTSFLGYFYTDDGFFASALWPAAGFSVGLYYTYGKRSILGIIIGALAAHLLARFLMFDETVFLSISYSIVFTGYIVIQAILFKRIMPDLEMHSDRNLLNALLYGVSAFIVSIIGGVISVSYIFITNSSIGFLNTLINWTMGDFFGILIFGVAVIFSNIYDSKIIKTKKNALMSGLYIASFIVFSYIIFSETFVNFTYVRFGFLFMLLYFAMSFFFSYRILLTINCIYIIMYQLFLTTTSTETNLGYLILSLNFYLLILSTVAVIIRMVLHNLETRNSLLSKSNKRLEEVIDSTYSLLKLSDDLLNPNSKMGENYIKRMFTIATKIFDYYDTASCYIKGFDKVTYIDAIGYDVDYLNSLDWDIDGFIWEMEKPIHIVKAEKRLKGHVEDTYQQYNERYDPIEESIRFGIYIEQDIVGAMSFDILEKSGKKFQTHHYESFASFQKLMNSFFEINSLNYKNNNLKNDIVLSLVRTLELYDHYTGGHSEDVAYMSGQIAERMGLPEEEIYNIFWAGIVHDIGKIGIKSEILNKPEKLTLEEYNIVKEHPVFGYDILNKSEALKDIAKLVRHHHEWWNGEGYPDGISKEDIPLGSQILTVCDSVSSMATKRPYTIVKSSYEILQELKLYKGIQFSPKVVDEMIKFIEEGKLDWYYEHK